MEKFKSWITTPHPVTMLLVGAVLGTIVALTIYFIKTH